MQNRERLQYIFERYLNDLADESEKSELANLIRVLDEVAVYELLNEFWDSSLPGEPVFNELESESILKAIISKGATKNNQARLVKFRWQGIAATVAILMLLFTGSYFLLKNDEFAHPSMSSNRITPENDLAPGGNRAILTLDGGSRILLDTLTTGAITRQEGALIVKSGIGQIEYQSDHTTPAKMVYNTISTPPGGEYQLSLPDGSKVWLNAASSIKFPTSFDVNERRVSITGEVYFEVIPLQLKENQKNGGAEKSGKVPFTVDIAGKGTVEVLGTQFNINSYESGNAIKTTLLEGSIRFTTSKNPGTTKSGSNLQNQKSVLLTPGTQLSLMEGGEIVLDKNVDIERIIAWKNGYFLFSYDTLPEVMSQIARWYDIEVIFEGPDSNRKFAGKMQRNLKLSEALKILENNHIRFKLEGRNLYVLN